MEWHMSSVLAPCLCSEIRVSRLVSETRVKGPSAPGVGGIVSAEERGASGIGTSPSESADREGIDR
jgi:hypothetical protein